MFFAVMIAVVADGLQIPLQVPPLPQIIDVVAMVLTSALIGFHLLLLPTFVVEFIPGLDMLPTWTGCVLAVIAHRRWETRNQPQFQEIKPPIIPPAPPPPKLGPPPENGA
jgi:hypothetical protein